VTEPNPPNKRHPSHDSGYKLLYSHLPMVRDLLRGFVPGAWIEELDFSTLEKCSGSYVSDDLRDRADDVIWRVRWGDDWLYVYLLLEFQSSVDPWMAVRIQTYLGLLYQDLIRTRQLSDAGKLPPVLPLVLYNGFETWAAAASIDALIEPAPPLLAAYRPQQGYLLLDERRLVERGALPQRNLSAALFQLEASRQPAEVMRILHALLEWLKAPQQAGLRRAFAVWFGRVFLPKRLPGVAFPPLSDLFEVHHMLTDHVDSWTEQWKNEGIAQGIEKGLVQGIEKGLAQGLEKGREETRHLLIRQTNRRFGPMIAAQAEPLLAAVADPRQLEHLGDCLLTCHDGAQWLQALREAQGDLGDEK
jgi:predicted transposase YdaD